MDLALIRADVLGPTNDVVKRPMIHVTGTKNGVDLLPGSAGEPEGGGLPLQKASRFYVKRRIIIGNAAKSLTGGKNEKSPEETGDLDALQSSGQQPTHKWRIYVKSPNKSTDDIRSFIRAVRFFLHPSFKPHDVIDVLSPPFELLRTGWGEFPVRLQIFFWDPLNKPVEIVHLIRVLTATTGKYMTMAEQAHDLDLDRRTDFTIGLAPDLISAPLPPQEEDQSMNIRVSDEDVLMMAIADFPLAGKRGKRAISSRYRPVATMEEFLRLSLTEQKQQERARAAALCSHLMTVFPTFSLAVDEVVKWCRDMGFTPASVSTFTSALERIDLATSHSLLYCRFCGLAHLPQDKFEILQKNCSLRPRKIHVTSRTPSQDLFNSQNYVMLPENSETVKRLKQECFGPSFMPYYPPDANFQREEKEICDSETSDVDLRRSFVNSRIHELHLTHTQLGMTPTVACMERAMRSFLSILVDHAVAEIPESKERSADRPVLLTPLHVFRAIPTHPELDFLSNAHMLGSAQTKDSPGG
jgi:hypothetical protein